jgi:hypothetical protein
MSIKNPQLPKVNDSHGAPMGRRDWVSDFTERCRCFRVRFVDGAYDEGGAYWGSPANVYCATNGEGVRTFTRANSRKEAKENIKKKYPEIKWIN